MSLSGLADLSREPQAHDLAALLGPVAELWATLIAAIAETHSPAAEVWNFSGAKTGWTLRLKRKERVILYLIPQAGSFLVGLVLGERAYQVVRALDVPPSVREIFDAAPRYAEGRGFRVPVASDEDMRAIVQLVAAKMTR